MKNKMSTSYLSLGAYWINFTAPLTCPHRGTTFHMDLMKPQENPCLLGKHTELGIDFVLLTMTARLMRSLFSLAKNVMHKRIWCWKLLPSACVTKAFHAMLWMICNVMELLLAMEVTNTICRKKYSTHKLAGNTGVTMSSVSIKYHLAAEPSTPEGEEVPNIELMEQLQDTLTMEKMVSKEPLLPSCTNPFILSMICQPSDDDDSSSTLGESDGSEWETEDDGLGWEKEESSSTEMSTDSGLQEFWTPVSKAEDGKDGDEETREDEESDWSDSDSWDTDSNPDSKVDEDLWASFCQNDDPYNPLCFSMPTKCSKKPLDVLDADTTNLGAFDSDKKLSGTDSETQEPGCGKRVRFSPDVTVIALPEEDDNERKGPWEEYARDRCRFQKRIKETGDAINYCLEPKYRHETWKRLHGRD
uniref:Protein phosphatase 1 regulatory subunit 15A n=1 Tax=Leptobrachium leishanense TaxID=445787 RepID=A0A8C5R0J7_9ANUR